MTAKWSIKEAMNNSKSIALTSDFWTFLGTGIYCGIIGHLNTEDWNLIVVVLGSVHVVNVTILLILLNYVISLQKTGVLQSRFKFK